MIIVSRLGSRPHRLLETWTESEACREIVAAVSHPAHGEGAAEVIVLADEARWIWALVAELVPQAIQILDFSHVKPYLWEAGKLIYGDKSAFVAPWVQERQALLLQDKVEQVITHLQRFLDLALALAPIILYFEQNAARMRYGTDRARGFFSGSGAIESAGKQISAVRIKGPGMRWNVPELKALLPLRCVFLEQSWPAYWEAQIQKAA